MSARSLWPLLPALLALPACGTVHDWRELRTAPMPYGECFDGVVHVATGSGLVSDDSVTDRGLGIFQSRWRTRTLPVTRRVARYRLRLEVMLDEGDAKIGWPIRFAVDQEVVKDPRRDVNPRDEDWSRDGQEREKETILGEALARRLAPKPMPRAESGRQP